MSTITEKLPLLNQLTDINTRRWSIISLIKLVNRSSDYCVVDGASEEYLREIVDHVNGTLDDCGVPILHIVEPGGLLKKLLKLGLNPDVLSYGVTACGPENFYPRYDYGEVKPASLAKAEVLSKCRPDLKAANHQYFSYRGNGCLTLEDGAKTRGYPDIAKFWKKVSEDGFPSLAQLAHDQDWYAVHNLCRRRVVAHWEKQRAYNGKTAIEWVQHHGTIGLEREMRYLLQINEVPVQKEGEQDEVKEFVLLNVTKTQEELDELKTEMVKLKRQLEDMRAKQSTNELRKQPPGQMKN